MASARPPRGSSVADAHFRTFFEALPDAAYAVELPDRTIFMANAAAAAMYGYSIDELIGQPATILWEDPTTVTPLWVAPGEQLESTRMHRRKDGRVFPTQTVAGVVEMGGHRYGVGIVRDVTEARRVSQELHDSRALLQNAFDDSPLGMIISDLETGRYVDVNPSFTRIVGYAREEVVGKVAWELGIVDREARERMAAGLAATGHVLGLNMPVTRKDGRRLSCRFWLSLVDTGAGKRIFATFEDVTEREAFERARTEVADRLEKLARRVPGVVYQFRIKPDGSATVPFTSPGMRDLFNVDLDVIRSDASSIFAAIHLEDVAEVQASIGASASTLTMWDHQFRVRLPTGERWLQANAMPEREADGNTLWHGFIHDITDRKQLQMALAQGDRLSSMGMLAAGVAHEINNPLSYVLSNLDHLADDLPSLIAFSRRCATVVRERMGEAALAEVLTGDARALATNELDELIDSTKAALEGVQRIRRITRGLGTFARVEQAEIEPIDLNQAVETACTMARNELKLRARLDKDLGELPPVRGTEGKLAQVFLNLLINAAHAIPEGQVEAHRVVVRTWASGGDVFADVQDSGRGIPSEHLERIFEPFFTTKPAGVGSGLGLAISRNLVREFGGDISVESEVGRGTRFRLRLPAHVGESTLAQTVAVGPVVPQGRARILVVDDEAPIRRSLARVLSRDHELVAVGSGREAKALLEKDHGFDLVLCDLMMPDMTGMELHAWLATAVPELAARVVFCSGGAFTPNASAYLDRVGNPRLDKPFDHAQLRALASERAGVARGLRSP